MAQAISLMGDCFDTIVLAALVARYAVALTGDETRSGLAISGLLLARFLPPLLVSPIAGVLLDRFDRKKLLIFSDVARVFIVLGLLLATTPDRLWLIYLLTILQFVVSSLFEPGRNALLPSICREEDLVTANLLGSMTWSVMLAVGGMLGGFVAGQLGTSGALVIDAATFAVLALLIAQIKPVLGAVMPKPGGANRTGTRLCEGFCQRAALRPPASHRRRRTDCQSRRQCWQF
ncbi:MAG: MFS transporter [Anaerolineae bacterium]